MFEFHDDGIAFLKAHIRALLGDEPGLGKSRQLALAAEPPILVVAPAMVLDAGVWDDEMLKWRPELEPGVDFVHTPYTWVSRREPGPKGGSRPTGFPRKELQAVEWGAIILDECHHLTGRNARQTEATERLLKRHGGRTEMSTGTPISGWATDLFMISRLLHGARDGDLQFGSFWRWAKRYWEVDSGPFAKREIGRFLDDTPEGWLRFYEDNLGDLFLARTWDEVLPEVPPMDYQRVDCPMAGEQKRLYTALKKDYVAWVESTGREVSAWSAAGLHTKLDRLTTGIELLDPTWDGPPTGKLARLRDDLATLGGEQLLVVSHYRDAVEAAGRLAEGLGISVGRVHGGLPAKANGEAAKRFRAGKTQVLFGTIKKLAEGLNFSHVNRVIRLERCWIPNLNLQVSRRVRRIDDLSPKVCVDYVAPQSLDGRKLRIVGEKTEQQLKALRARELMGML